MQKKDFVEILRNINVFYVYIFFSNKDDLNFNLRISQKINTS